MGAVVASQMSTGVALLTRSETLSLYRALLRSALTFPSMRRASIVTDIRTEFRDHAGVTDPVQLKAMVREAECALFELRRFDVGGKDSASASEIVYSQVELPGSS